MQAPTAHSVSAFPLTPAVPSFPLVSGPDVLADAEAGASGDLAFWIGGVACVLGWSGFVLAMLHQF